MQADAAGENNVNEQLERHEGYLASDPGNMGLLAKVIDLCFLAGDAARAHQHAEAAVALYPDDPYFRYRWAHVLMAHRKWDDAVAVLSPLAAQHPDVNVGYSLANSLIQLGRHQQAFEALLPYRDTADLAADAVTLLVRALHHMGDLDQAGLMIEQHRERLASDAAFLGAASLVRLDEGNIEDAAILSDAAMAAGGNSLEAMVVGGSLALAHNDASAAIERFNQVLAVNPQEGRSWSGLGMASLMRRDLSGAAVQLENAVKYMPKHIGTIHALAWCKIFSQDLDGAEAAFTRALEMDRNFGESHGGVAVVAALKGEREKAEGGIERALRLDPQSLAARYAQMVLSGQTSDPERFKAIAMRLLSTRTTALGENLADVVKRHAGD